MTQKSTAQQTAGESSLEASIVSSQDMEKKSVENTTTEEVLSIPEHANESSAEPPSDRSPSLDTNTGPPPKTQGEYDEDAHMLSFSELAERYGTVIEPEYIGLTESEAALRLKRDGPNVLSPPKGKPEWLKYLECYTNLFLVLMEIAVIMAFIAFGLTLEKDHIILAGVLIVVIAFTATSTYYQQRTAGSAVDSIKKMLPSSTKVIRGGGERNVPAEELVVGDLVHLTVGNRVPADIRLLSTSALRVEMSSLTGEPDAIECTPERQSDSPVESRCLIFNSAMVMSGDCVGVVCRTGDRTMIGSIAGVAGAKSKKGKTTMEIEVLRIVRFVSAVAIVMSFTFLAIGLARDLGVVFSFVNAFILVLVANVPEGLPTSITSILNLTSQELASRNVFIKRTDLIETLGSASVICTDKTGTLTLNQMTVSNMWFNGVFTRVSDAKIKRAAALTAQGPQVSLSGADGVLTSDEQHEKHLEVMRIGRSMSFIRHPGGEKTAVIHSSNTLPTNESIADSRQSITGEISSEMPEEQSSQAERRPSARISSVPSRRNIDKSYFPPMLTAMDVTLLPKPADSNGVHELRSIDSLRVPPADLTESDSEGEVEQRGQMTAESTAGGTGLQERSHRPARSRQGSSFNERERITTIGRADSFTAISGLRGMFDDLDTKSTENATQSQRDPRVNTVSTVTPDAAAIEVMSMEDANEILEEPSPNEQSEASPVFRSIVSFQTFRGLQTLKWEETNAFTRLCCIAAVCNKAKFADTGEDLSDTFAKKELSPTPGVVSTVPREIGDLPEVSVADMDEDEGELEGGRSPTIADELPKTTNAEKSGTKRKKKSHHIGFRSKKEERVEEKSDKVENVDVNEIQPLGSFRILHTEVRDGIKHTRTVRLDGKEDITDTASSSRGRNQWGKKEGDVESPQITRRESFIGKAAPAAKPPRQGEREVLGDASEAALLRYVDGLTPIHSWRAALPTIFELPFNSDRKWAAAACQLGDEHELILIKGAPERVFERCNSHYLNGLEQRIDAEFRKSFGDAYERFGMLGERVLGFAYVVIPARGSSYWKNSSTDELTEFIAGLPYVFCGLISLIDPPKPGTLEAVQACRGGGIAVSMVTGDHPLTAEAIARKVAIITQTTPRELAHKRGVPESEVPLTDPEVGAVVLPGTVLPLLSDDEWNSVLKKEVVFARTTPQQKVEIVKRYQALGHVVAVTGDGTNDAPALKTAQIGISMGSTRASDVARETADMILMDDSFVSIVFAIEKGRLVFDNIRKTIAYTLSHCFPEVIPIFVLLVFDVPLMLPGLLVLLVDVVCEQGPAISLAYEPGESSLMLRPPRDRKKDRLLDKSLVFTNYIVIGALIALACIMAFMTTFLYYDVPVKELAYNRDFWQTNSPPLTLDDGRVLSAEEQTNVYRRGVSAFFLTLILCQCSNAFLSKTTFSSIFNHPLLKNWRTLVGIAFSISVAAFVVYTPAVHDLFNANYMNGIWWTIFIAFFILALPFTEFMKWRRRRRERKRRANLPVAQVAEPPRVIVEENLPHSTINATTGISTHVKAP